MKQLTMIVGEHLLEVQSDASELMNMFKSNFHCLSEASFASKPDLMIQIEEGYGIPFFDYEVAVSKEANKIVFRRADYLIEVDAYYQAAHISVNNELALKHALLTLYSSFIVHHKWGLLLHASCVVDNGEAHLFAGHSGAGKSTAARLSYPRQLLSDEATLVKITPTQITVFNSPFRSELGATGSEKCSPLASIHILYQAKQNSRISLRKSNGFLHLMDKVFYWAHNPVETRIILNSMFVLVKTVPIYELHFQKNNTFWEMIS